MEQKKGYQVWSYSWSDEHGPIPEHVLFGGHIFPTRKEADDKWYLDYYPGPNDKHVVLPCGAKHSRSHRSCLEMPGTRF